MAEIRQLVVLIRRGSASIVEYQAVLAQLVVQRLARQAERFGDAAQRAVWARQFRGNQRTLEGNKMSQENFSRMQLIQSNLLRYWGDQP